MTATTAADQERLTFLFAEAALRPVGVLGGMSSPAACVVAVATGDGGESPAALGSRFARQCVQG